MAGPPHRFDRLELAGSLGDLGTIIPLSVALITIAGLGFSPVFGLVGLFYVATGLYYRLPMPVQPLKVVAAVAIAYPGQISQEIIAAAAYIFAALLLIMAATNFIEKLARLFTKPIVRGIQLGLGLILITKGVSFIAFKEMFGDSAFGMPKLFGLVSLNPLLGLIGVVVVLLLLNSRRFPAALILVAGGVLSGLVWGKPVTAHFGPTQISLIMPMGADWWNALSLLVIPQIPLTIGNAIIGTKDTARSLFGTGDKTTKVTNRSLTLSMGLANLLVGLFGAMPMCHGSGGLAAHYRFGARTGGSNIMIGLIFLAIALAFGQAGLAVLSLVPQAVLGVLLLFAGLELALLIRDLSDRKDLFITLFIAGIAVATTNMAVAFLCGMVVAKIMDWAKVDV